MTQQMNLQDCIDLATFAHRHQYDKAGHPYIEHPLRVLASVQAQGARPYVQMAAVLHDVTEDTPFTAQMLLDLGVPEAAVEIVKLVDRDYSEWYHFAADGPLNLTRTGDKEQINYFYYEAIKKNPGAVQVKTADIGDNLQPWRLVYLPEDTQARLRKKYSKALQALS